jgi:hypothetical protein
MPELAMKRLSSMQRRATLVITVWAHDRKSASRDPVRNEKGPWLPGSEAVIQRTDIQLTLDWL